MIEDLAQLKQIAGVKEFLAHRRPRLFLFKGDTAQEVIDITVLENDQDADQLYNIFDVDSQFQNLNASVVSHLDLETLDMAVQFYIDMAWHHISEGELSLLRTQIGSRK